MFLSFSSGGWFEKIYKKINNMIFMPYFIAEPETMQRILDIQTKIIFYSIPIASFCASSYLVYKEFIEPMFKDSKLESKLK